MTEEELLERAQKRFAQAFFTANEELYEEFVKDYAFLGPRAVKLGFWKRLWRIVTFRKPYNLNWSWSQ